MTYDGPDLHREDNAALDNARRFGVPAIATLIGLLFVFQNTQDITFEFLWFDFTAPLWTMLVAFAAIGAVMLWGAQRRIARRGRAG